MICGRCLAFMKMSFLYILEGVLNLLYKNIIRHAIR